jgi:hypothetical protein
LLALVACAPGKIEPLQGYRGSPLARPAAVIVDDFAASPEQVKLDRGLGARLRGAASGASDAAQHSEEIHKVTAAIAAALVEEIRKFGLPAQRSAEAPAGGGGDVLIIGGRILSIDEGNRSRRNVVGFGAGGSAVSARTEVYYDAGGAGPRLVEAFDATAESPRKPGAVGTMGVGAATGRVAESALAGAGSGLAPGLGGDAAADGARMAKAIAKQLAGFFASQGWVPATASP